MALSSQLPLAKNEKSANRFSHVCYRRQWRTRRARMQPASRVVSPHEECRATFIRPGSGSMGAVVCIDRGVLPFSLRQKGSRALRVREWRLYLGSGCRRRRGSNGRDGSTRAGRACLAAAIHHPRVGRGTHCLGYSSTRNVPLGRLADATLRDAKSRRRGRVDRIIQAVPCRRHVLRSLASSWKALKVTPACCNAPAASNSSC